MQLVRNQLAATIEPVAAPLPPGLAAVGVTAVDGELRLTPGGVTELRLTDERTGAVVVWALQLAERLVPAALALALGPPVQLSVTLDDEGATLRLYLLRGEADDLRGHVEESPLPVLVVTSSRRPRPARAARPAPRSSTPSGNPAGPARPR